LEPGRAARLPEDYTADVRYVGTRGVHLNVQNRLNIVNVVTPNQFLPTYSTSPGQAALDALPLTLADLQAQSHFLPAYEDAGFTTPIVGSCLGVHPSTTACKPS
jgi:hypothetical protein